MDDGVITIDYRGDRLVAVYGEQVVPAEEATDLISNERSERFCRGIVSHRVPEIYMNRANAVSASIDEYCMGIGQ